MVLLFSFQRAMRYFQQAADAGNANAMAFLGKVGVLDLVFRMRCEHNTIIIIVFVRQG